MRKYVTWRAIGLHAVVLVVVPGCLVAGWWQYHVALGGNDLSWVYTVEWPFFAAYALYVWWQIIHDRSTPFDRLWAAKQRAAADESGRPLHEIPGWAMDKELSQAVAQASKEAAAAHELAVRRADALGSGKPVGPTSGPPVIGSVDLAFARRPPVPPAIEQQSQPPNPLPAPAVIDARVVDDRIVVDEELDAYNRYLAELSLSDPAKRWNLPHRRDGSSGAPAAEPPTDTSASPPDHRAEDR